MSLRLAAPCLKAPSPTPKSRHNRPPWTDFPQGSRNTVLSACVAVPRQVVDDSDVTSQGSGRTQPAAQWGCSFLYHPKSVHHCHPHPLRPQGPQARMPTIAMDPKFACMWLWSISAAGDTHAHRGPLRCLCAVRGSVFASLRSCPCAGVHPPTFPPSTLVTFFLMGTGWPRAHLIGRNWVGGGGGSFLGSQICSSMADPSELITWGGWMLRNLA